MTRTPSGFSRLLSAATLWVTPHVVRGGGAKKSQEKGLPIGNLTSQLFANVYMNELDQFMKHDLRLPHYARYTDDFLVVDSSEAELRRILPAVRAFLRERLALELHPDKVEIRRYSKGVDFLGYVAFPYFRLMRKRTERRMMRKLHHVIAHYTAGVFDEKRAEASLLSYLGMLSHADAYRLSEKLRNDFWMQTKSRATSFPPTSVNPPPARIRGDDLLTYRGDR